MPMALVQAQAKINLVLRVGPRGHDGYHEIATVFQRIELADQVVVRLGGIARSVDCAGPVLPAGGLGPAEQNLAYRAAIAYAERAKWLHGFAIEITKHIPVGGGLGGGSADAAAVLRALEALAPYSLERSELVEIATRLGADVVFFTKDHVRAIGLRRGQLLQALAPLPAREVLLVVPNFGISTPDAYRWLDEAGGGTYEPGSDGLTIDQLSAVDWTMTRQLSHNDFESVVERRFPELQRLRQSLGTAGASIARLSGSGSTVFGVFDGSAPDRQSFEVEALIIPTRTSSRVVQVEVLE